MTPEGLSKDLRTGSGPFLKRRRGIIALKYVEAVSLGMVALYQTGVIPHLPDPPVHVFDSDRVDASRDAYKLLAVPDAALGITNAGVTLTFAAIGRSDRYRRQPWLPLLLAGKISFDAAQAARLFVNQLTKQHALCFYCTVAAFASFATVPLAVAETHAALAQLLGRGDRPMSRPLRVA